MTSIKVLKNGPYLVSGDHVSTVDANGSEYRVVASLPLGRAESQSVPVQTASFDASLGSDDGWDRTS